jgi:uncharacterized protein YndB with AHSA1/START domain
MVTNEPLELSFRVGCSAEEAFDTFAVRTSLWWPPQHSFSGQEGITVTFEPFPGGRIYERTRDGAEHDWGEVVVWERPSRLVYLWHLATDRSDATEVEVAFTGDESIDGTLVAITHRGWDRLGDSGAARRERNQEGWSGLLLHYRSFLEG